MAERKKSASRAKALRSSLTSQRGLEKALSRPGEIHKKFTNKALTNRATYDIIYTERKKEVHKMTAYEINYRNRLNEMLDELILNLGFEDKRVILFATYKEKLENQATYQNREKMEKMFKAYMK